MAVLCINWRLFHHVFWTHHHVLKCHITELPYKGGAHSLYRHMKRQYFRGFSTTFWIRPATWLHSMHEIAVSISRSPQRSWWGLVLAETWPARWVTSRPIFKGDVVRWLFMNIWCMYEAHMSPAFNGSLVIWGFEGSNVLEICKWINYSSMRTASFMSCSYFGIYRGSVWGWECGCLVWPTKGQIHHLCYTQHYLRNHHYLKWPG